MGTLKKALHIFKEATVGPLIAYFRVGRKTVRGARIAGKEAKTVWTGFQILIGLFEDAYKKSVGIDRTKWCKNEYRQEYEISQELPFVKYKDYVAQIHLVLWILTVALFFLVCFSVYKQDWAELLAVLLYLIGVTAFNIMAISYFIVMNRYKAVIPYPVYLSRVLCLDKAIFLPKSGD